MNKILVIEDDVHMQQMLTTLIERAGFDADIVYDGLDGLKMFAENEYDLVVTDMNMPDIDGLEVITEIQKVRPDIPIITISGGDPMQGKDMTKLHQSRKMNVFAIFKKPFSHDEFIETVRNAIGSEDKTEQQSA